MRLLRIPIIALLMVTIVLVWQGPSMPANAASTVGRNFRFQATENDQITIRITETCDLGEYISIKTNRGETGISQDKGTCSNGTWTFSGSLEPFIEQGTTSTVDVSLGGWGTVALNDVNQPTIDSEFLSTISVQQLEVEQLGTNAADLVVKVDVQQSKAVNKWVTLEFSLSINNLTSEEAQRIRSELNRISGRIDTFRRLGINVFEDNEIFLNCSDGHQFAVLPRVKFGPGNEKLGNRNLVICPGGDGEEPSGPLEPRRLP